MKTFIKLLNACLFIIGLFLIGYSIDKWVNWSCMFLGFGCVTAIFYLDESFKDEEK